MSQAHIWFCRKPTERQNTFDPKGWDAGLREHPPGYVVEVGGGQYHLGVKTLDEAKAFARSKGATSFYHVEGIEREWEGRDGGDELPDDVDEWMGDEEEEE